MKWIAAFVAAMSAAFFSTLAARADSAVTPAVGVIKVVVPPGLSLMSVPMERDDGSTHTLDSVFGSALADESEVMIYVSGRYVSYVYFAGMWLNENFEEAGATLLGRGQGFWISNPLSESKSVYVRGKVPVSQIEVSLPTGLAMVGFGFPLVREINSAAGIVPSDEDEIYFFQEGRFVSFIYFGGEWLDEEYNVATVTFNPCVGAWYWRKGQETSWEQNLPDEIDL